MNEKKLYKIAFMGDKDHGCDIISTLKSWGGSNYYSRSGSDPEYVYFINDLGTIDLIHNSEMLSEEMKKFYFIFWHDYNIECHLKVGEYINYDGQDYDVDSILFDANNRCIVYKLKSFGIGVEYITNNELTPTEECQTEEENNEFLFKNNIKNMNTEDYKLYTWYPLTDNEYWVDDAVLQMIFPGCQTIVCDTMQGGLNNHIMTFNNCHLGWGTMVKRGTFNFMIIEKPKNE